jgi:hypothetical protein
MSCPGQLHFPKSSAVGRVLVRDPLVWCHALPLQQLAHELTRGLRVALGLEEHIQDLAFRIHSPPQVHLFATDTNEHLIEVPPSMRLRAFRPQPSCDGWAKGEDPAPNGFVRDHDAPLG